MDFGILFLERPTGAKSLRRCDDYSVIRLQRDPVALVECGPESRYQDMPNMMQAVPDYRLEETGAVLVIVWPAGGPEDSYR